MMTVYVDNARIPYGRMKMSHMVADSLDELHTMADRIGLARRHFQGRTKHPHYDVCAAYRNHAIILGAVPVDSRKVVKVAERCRDSCSRWAGVAGA